MAVAAKPAQPSEVGMPARRGHRPAKVDDPRKQEDLAASKMTLHWSGPAFKAAGICRREKRRAPTRRSCLSALFPTAVIPVIERPSSREPKIR